jgi:hypothetical protein
VPIDKLAEAIGKGVGWIIKRWDTQTIQARHDSVVTLSLQISNLAGREMALVSALSMFINDPSAAVAAGQGTRDRGYAHARTFAKIEELNRLVDEIKTNFDSAARTLDSIDPTWAAHNPGLVAGLGAFVYDSAIRYIPVWTSPRSQFRSTC